MTESYNILLTGNLAYLHCGFSSEKEAESKLIELADALLERDERAKAEIHKREANKITTTATYSVNKIKGEIKIDRVG